ncbi:hypothetical protein PQX77_020265 [Marasmius sp. AFHP31]|nr:hypothetical protein PQX77_020265 [Marasmius sp. AFHP31]
MNNDIPWHECLRLQGKREEQWLRLCGYAPDQIPGLVEERRKFRAATITRYTGRLIERCAYRDRMLRLIRSYSRDLNTPTLYRGRQNKTRGKAYCEAEHDDAESEITQLQDMIRRLEPPRLILRRRRRVQASEEVEALISRMAERVSDGSSS